MEISKRNEPQIFKFKERFKLRKESILWQLKQKELEDKEAS